MICASWRELSEELYPRDHSHPVLVGLGMIHSYSYPYWIVLSEEHVPKDHHCPVVELGEMTGMQGETLE
jgi:hypothetical protein